MVKHPGQTPLSEMSKASHGRQQETDNLSPVFKLVKLGATAQAPFPIHLNILYLETSLTKMTLRVFLLYETDKLGVFLVRTKQKCTRCRCISTILTELTTVI